MTNQDFGYRLLQAEDDDFEWDESIPYKESGDDRSPIDDIRGQIPETWEAMLAQMTPGSWSR